MNTTIATAGDNIYHCYIREIRLANGVVGLLISKSWVVLSRFFRRVFLEHRRSSVSGVGGQRKSECSRTEKGAEREEEDDDELLGVSQSEEETEGENSSVRSSDEESESNESDTEDEEDSMIKVRVTLYSLKQLATALLPDFAA